MRKALSILCASLLCIALVMVFGPKLHQPGKEKCAMGIVTSVYGSAQKDLVIRIAGLKKAFCISGRKLKNFSVQDLKEQILGKQVKVLYADGWTPLDPGCNKNIEELRVDNKLLYSGENK